MDPLCGLIKLNNLQKSDHLLEMIMEMNQFVNLDFFVSTYEQKMVQIVFI